MNRKIKFNKEIIVIGCENCGNSKCVNLNPSDYLISVTCECGNKYIDVEFDFFHNCLGRVLNKIKE